MLLSPRKQSFSNIMINSLGSLIAGVIGSITIVILTFLLSNYFSVVGVLSGVNIGLKVSPIFLFIMSIITLLGTFICSTLTYHIMSMTDPEKYKKNHVLSGQLALFQVICYALITPIYMYVGANNFDSVLAVYLLHILFTVFGTSIILEVFNNYRYILVGLYGILVGQFINIILSIIIYFSFAGGLSKMIILIFLLPLSNFIIIFVKQLFEFLYHLYYTYTSLDPIGDIFYQIELEEEEKLSEEEDKNSI